MRNLSHLCREKRDNGIENIPNKIIRNKSNVETREKEIRIKEREKSRI